jgi:hypothetical protein
MGDWVFSIPLNRGYGVLLVSLLASGDKQKTDTD